MIQRGHIWARNGGQLWKRFDRQNAELRRRMAEVYEALQADKRKQADRLARIGMALDRVGLDDLVEIGQRMLGGRPVA